MADLDPAKEYLHRHTHAPDSQVELATVDEIQEEDERLFVDDTLQNGVAQINLS